MLLAADPERTAKSLFYEIQARNPLRHPTGQLRTFQRRVAGWRAQAILEFNDGWLEDDAPLGAQGRGTLHLRLDCLSKENACSPTAQD